MIVYTAICGDYPVPPRTDVKCFKEESIFIRAVMDAKRYKLLPHLFFPHESVTFWIDGNISINADGADIARRFLGDADMALFCHPVRKTVWQEFYAISVEERFQIPWLQAQLIEQEQAYRKAGLGDDASVYECNVLIRRQNERVNRLMDAWWAEICRWQWRDQVSLPYVLWKYGAGMRINPIYGDVRDHPDFTYVRHS